MQVVENYADIRGKIVSAAPHATHGGFAEMEIELSQADSVAAFPNLFADRVGTTLKVNIPNDQLDSLQTLAGRQVSARIKLSGPNTAFAQPASVTIE